METPFDEYGVLEMDDRWQWLKDGMAFVRCRETNGRVALQFLASVSSNSFLPSTTYIHPELAS
jgi:hypothetical protein